MGKVCAQCEVFTLFGGFGKFGWFGGESGVIGVLICNKGSRDGITGDRDEGIRGGGILSTVSSTCLDDDGGIGGKVRNRWTGKVGNKVGDK